MKPETPIVALGELLWDLLPTGRRAGGAPFNFAFHCHQLGHPAVIVSRVGDDDPGRELRAEVRRLGMTDEYIQTDPEHPTGTVRVEVGADGQPVFTIADDVAWDYIGWEPRVEALAFAARAVCFGTLAQRRPVTRALVTSFIRNAPETALVVCDLNIRPPFMSEEVFDQSVRFADWLKVSESDALSAISMADDPAFRNAQPATGRGLWAMLFPLCTSEGAVVAVTQGAGGCVVGSGQVLVELPGHPIPVADTVGCGDAFTAALMTQSMEGKSLTPAARFANAYAAVVASKPGGTPPVERAEVERLL